MLMRCSKEAPLTTALFFFLREAPPHTPHPTRPPPQGEPALQDAAAWPAPAAPHGDPAVDAGQPRGGPGLAAGELRDGAG